MATEAGSLSDQPVGEAETENQEQMTESTESAMAVDTDATIKVDTWELPEVIQWLESKELHQFIPLFQQHGVTGKDLCDLNIPFLKDYDNIDLDERELLLSEIYNLLNPATVYASDDDLTKITSPIDRKKYYAAIELAQGKSASLPRSCSVFVLPHSSPKSSTLTRSSPVSKPRHKSESGVERSKPAKMDGVESGPLKRRTAQRNFARPRSRCGMVLYDYVQKYGSRCINCVTLSAEHRSMVTMATDSEHQVTISDVPDELLDRLHPADRVLEINGQFVQPQTTKDETKSHLTSLLQLHTPARIVTLTEPSGPGERDPMEEKWRTLHTMLVDMRDSDAPMDAMVTPQPDATSLNESPSPDDHIKHATIMQEEIEALKEALIEQQTVNEDLQLELDDTNATLHDLELSRDKAIEKLRQSRSTAQLPNSRDSLGGAEYFNMTINSLSLEDKCKEEVVESLKEIVMEASKQKWYLDRLISLVIEESPWLLDEVDSAFDNLTLSDKSEEFC